MPMAWPCCWSTQGCGIEDKYITGTRLRLRKISDEAGAATIFKLGKKYGNDRMADW